MRSTTQVEDATGYRYSLPDGLATGPVTVTATVWYSKLVSSLASFLEVPAEETTPVKLAQHQTTFVVVEP